MKTRRANRINRHKRVRAKIAGTSTRPRLSVFRSHKHIHLQLIDDEKGATLAAASTREVAKKSVGKARAEEVAKRLAEKAFRAGIKRAVFDRGGYLYHGQVAAVGKALREAGLKI